MSKIKKYIDSSILLIFPMLLIISEVRIFKDVPSLFILILGITLSIVRAIYFYRFFDMEWYFSIILFITFSIYTYFHSSLEISDLTLVRYLTILNIVNLVNIILMIYMLFKIKAKYIFNMAVYIILSILLTIEYVPFIIYILEIFSYLVFLPIYFFTKDDIR